ncbi:MAG: stage sporulation protein [Clostridia bacterium]|nr:stage sporulation protein [Clostridia bacterium]
MRKLNYIQGAFILTLTNLITGVLAFVFRILLSRSIGAEGMGVFQLVLPLYTLFITLVSGGVTTAVSKLVAEQQTKSNYKNMHKIIKICCTLFGAWSVLIAIILSFNAGFVSQYILKDTRTLYSIIIFTPAIVFISISAIIRGYFFGLQDVNPPAAIDVAEKVVRLAGLVLAVKIMLPYGIAYVCAGAMLAMAVGELVSMLLLITTYLGKKRRSSKTSPTDSSLTIVNRILTNAIPLSVSGALVTIMEMLCAIIVPTQLIAAGFNKQSALSLYGELTGMAMPLLFFPFIIIVSLSITLVPAITASHTQRNWTVLNRQCYSSIKIAAVLGFGATALFGTFPHQLSELLFKSAHTGKLLFWLSFGCTFQFLEFTLFAISNGLGLQRKVLGYSIINVIILVLCSYILIPLPQINIYGYIIGFNLSTLLIVLKNSYDLKKIKQLKFKLLRPLAGPFISFVVMLFTLRFVYQYLLTLQNANVSLFISIAAGFIAYAFALIATRTITLKQISNTLSLK